MPDRSHVVIFAAVVSLMTTASTQLVCVAEEANVATATVIELPGSALLAERPAVLMHEDFAGGSASATDDNAPLVSATFNTKQDAMGFRWDIDQGGGIADGLNDCFDGGLALRVNGNQFGTNDRTMTADGLEYVFNGRVNNLHITRRVRLDLTRGAARYIELVTNPHSKDTVTVNLEVYTQMGGQTVGAVTSSGEPFSGGSLEKDDVGFMTVSQGGSRPNVVFVVGDPRGKVRPTIGVQNNRHTVTYPLTLKPGETQAVLHMVAQRPSGIGGTATEGMFEPFYKRRLLDPQVPRSLAKLLVNANVGAAIDGVRLTQAADDAANDAGFDRGEQDILVVDADASLVGDVTCNAVSVATAFGPTTVAWDEVALLEGGSGIAAPMRVHLRSGEILSGAVTTDSMTMASVAGGDMTLEPGQINLLVAAVSPMDDHPPAAAGGFVSTTRGDRLAISSDDDAPLKLVTPWGTLTTAMQNVASFELISDPQPAHVLRLKNGTRMMVMLGGGALEPNTVRFGTIELPPYTVAAVTRLQSLPDGDEATEALAAEFEKEQIASEQMPRVMLLGGNVIAGTITTPTITVLGPLGATAINTTSLASMSKSDDDTSPNQFTVAIRNGGTITGRIEQRMLEITAPERTWLVPTEHVAEVIVPPAEATP
jgi:hypothetical protein